MGTFNVTDGNGNVIPGTVSVSNENKRGIFTPAGPLPNGTTINVEVTTGVTSVNGVPMVAPFNSSFQTVAADNAPVILSVAPADGAVDVSVVGTEVVIDFAEPINPATLT